MTKNQLEGWRLHLLLERRVALHPRHTTFAVGVHDRRGSEGRGRSCMCA